MLILLTVWNPGTHIATLGVQGWLERLLDVFQECEDLESLDDLYVLSTILRNISKCAVHS